MNAVAPFGTYRDANLGDAERALVHLMREWTVLRRCPEPALPAFVACADLCGLNSHAAVAIDSMLALTEACLARPLRAEASYSQTLAADERAVLALLDQGRFIRGAYTPRTIPHGLPGVLAWATVAVRKAFTEAGYNLEALAQPTASCPFAP